MSQITNNRAEICFVIPRNKANNNNNIKWESAMKFVRQAVPHAEIKWPNPARLATANTDA